MVSRRLLTLWVACFWTALRLGKSAMDFHLRLGQRHAVGPRLRFLCWVGRGSWCKFRERGEGPGRCGGRELSAVHGSLRLGDEEAT